MVELSVLQKIERETYPFNMQQLQDCCNWKEVANYSEVSLSNLLVYTEKENMYILIGIHSKYIEVVDMASISHFNVFKALNFIKKAAKGKTIKFDAKEDTSYPLICKLAKHGKIQIIKDTVWKWNTVSMHEMEVIC